MKVKHLIYPLGILLLGISYIIPRKKSKWCFGSNMGFSNNAKYLFLHLCEKNYGVDCYWIGDKKEVAQIRSFGGKAYNRWSVKGLICQLTSSVYVYNSYVKDINLFTYGKAIRINLWHGVGIKNIERKITRGPLANIYNNQIFFNRVMHLNAFVKPDIMLSTSPLMTQHFSTCFGIEASKCIESIYPRCEIFKKKNAEIIEFVTRYEPHESLDLIRKLESYEYVFLYMPTWRDCGDYFFYKYQIDLHLINESLKESNSFLLIKLHPSSYVEKQFGTFSNVAFINRKIDIYPVMPFTNCLITDYSSVLYDYILLKDVKIILFTPDFDDYIYHSRDLAFPYNEYTCGERVNNMEGLIKILKSKEFTYSEQTVTYIQTLFWNKSNCTNDTLINELLKRIANIYGKRK